MFVLFMAIAAAIGAGLLVQAARRRSSWRAVAGGAVIAATALLFALMSFWGEMLWFEEVGYSGRFWTVVLTVAGMVVAGAVAGALGVALLTWAIPRHIRALRRWPVVAGALIGGAWGLLSWDTVLRYLNRVDTGVREPILGRDTGFYLFTLPFLDLVHWLLLGVAIISLITVAIVALSVSGETGRSGGAVPRTPAPSIRPAPAGPEGEAPPVPVPTGLAALARPSFITVGALLVVLAAGMYLDVFHLLYSRWGIVYGPGWTDVHVRQPAYQMIGALLAVAGAALVVVGASAAASRRFGGTAARLRRVILVPVGGIAVLWVTGLLILPLLFQWLRVTPNEITVERPYLAHNIAFTRQGFDLEKVEQQPFVPSGKLTPEVIAENERLLSEVRLWDPQALDAVLEQFQEIRLYYEMAELDIDRYVLGGRYRQVMVAAREMDQRNLPPQSQTFVNRRFKYTHGHGVAMASVRDFTQDGLPNLLVKDIPPVSQFPELHVDRPEIYYGQHTTGYVVVRTTEPEFDYPSGEHNVYSNYEGKGGVQLSNFWRKLVYAWKLGGTRLLFSSYPTDESRVLYDRNIRERVGKIAPFLHFDHDPYVVVVGGRLKWIVDAYTTSSYYPYSEPYFSGEVIEPVDGERPAVATANVASYLHGASYVRNAVKAVVDAYDGAVTFYVFEPADPIIQVWSRVFPGLFRSKAEMPPEILAHVRYPEGFLLAQGLVYAKYHMTDPMVFYNQEDLWIRATERYYDQIRPVDPYYVMWRPPGEDAAEFSLILPFTPKNRQVLVGWIAGLCDPENYGRLITYRLPKDQWVLGTQQVDTKIDQDRFLSAQLALWDQRGSRVIRGNVLVIPIGDTLLYVEPIYLQADEAAYPELRIVVLMHGDQMAYANTFDDALRALVHGMPAGAPGPEIGALTDGRAPAIAGRANEALGSYLRLLGERRFEEAAVQLRELERALRELEATPPPASAPLPGLPRD